MSPVTTVDLTGAGWRLTGGRHENLPVVVPVHALQALHDAGLVPDPLYRYNENELRWAALQIWKFGRTFNVEEGLLAHTCVDLLLSGVDTVADIQLNGHHLLTTDNAFREYRIPVRTWLRSGSNTLSITIHPAIPEADRRAKSSPYVVPSVQGPGMAANYSWLRKPACDAGWDWGPCFSPAGIFGRVELSAYSHAHLTGATTRQHWQPDGSVELEVIAAVQSAAPGYSGMLHASIASCTAHASVPVLLPLAGSHFVSARVCMGAKVKRWWPTGYGMPQLHDLKVTLAPEHTAANGSTNGVASSVSRRVGFKEVELVREPLADGHEGETFFFRVNGTPIFVKGSNIIPSNVFRGRETPEQEHALIRDAVAVHMNTVRIWGGGHYPSDALMDACDEAGVLMWLELMFGCAVYPRGADFLANVAAEVQQQMFRLAGHASALVLGGNNEVENSFDWFEQSRANPSLYAVDYTELFVNTVRPALQLAGPDIYVDGSPSNGLHSSDPYVKRWGQTNNPSYGDGHYYNYADDAFQPSTYPRSKFVSEFGFQSFPSFACYSAQTSAEDWAWDSDMSQHRQRHPNGQQELLDQLKRHFNLGDALKSTEQGFRRWIYLTQVQQALAYDAAVRHWRRIKHEPDARTMGILYWQHNDIWAGPSWSSINYDGSWKLLHHAAMRFFAPLVLSAELDKSGDVHIHITSDINSAIEGDWQVEVIPWRATQALRDSEQHTFSLAALGSAVVADHSIASLLQPHNLTRTEALLRITASARRTDDEGDATCSSCTEVYLSEFKDAATKDPGMSAGDFEKVSPSEVSFQLRSGAVAACVALETPLAGRFSDNAVLVLPWEPLTVTFTAAAGEVSSAELQQSLSIMSVHHPTSAV